jgi:hypothetical protein
MGRDAEATGGITFGYEGERRMTAGTLQRWTLRFTAQVDLGPGARIGIAHRWPSDWGIAQASNPAGVDYLEVETTDGASVRWWNARLHAWHPFDHIVFVELPEGLRAGESVAMRYGEGRLGSPGYRVQTFIEEASPFSLRWQAEDGAPWVEFARHAVEIVGAKPVRLVVSAPSLVASGAPAELHLRVEDEWGNPAGLRAPLEVELASEDVELSGSVTVPTCAWVRVPFVVARPGIRRIEARTPGTPTLRARSNPIEVSAKPLVQTLFWGDLHAQSVIGCGARSIDAYYAHARDFSASDFASHQANCFLVSRDEWRETASSTRRHHVPRRFVTFLGVEWSGATSVGGDHNLYFPTEEADLHRCSHEFVADKSDADTDLKHVEDVYRHYRGSDTLVAVHVGGRTADLNWHEPQLDRLLEVHSTHATSEWFLFDALHRGYRMGVIAGSDGVDGRPGNSHPGHQSVRNVRGGLTAILAPELTRAALWQALRERRCYATTGERIVLDFRAGAARMGDAIKATAARFQIRVEGTEALESIDLFRGTQLLRSIDCFAEAGALSNRVRVAWQGLSAPGNWQRARMNWDGELRIEGARILAAQGWAFDTPEEGLLEDDRDRGRARVGWRSVTAGDWDGVVLELDRPDDAELWFVTGPMSLRTRLSALGPKGRRFDAHNPQRSVELKRLPERMPSCAFSGAFEDSSPIPGEQAYWVRARQSDGACAWSSPIFVTVG